MGSTPQLVMSTFPKLFLLQSHNTFEANQEGFLGRVAYELHVAEWGPRVKNTMKHITYAPEYDRFDKSGIFEFFEINDSTVQLRKNLRVKPLYHALTTFSRDV
jgi:hypothetical protein